MIEQIESIFQLSNSLFFIYSGKNKFKAFFDMP